MDGPFQTGEAHSALATCRALHAESLVSPTAFWLREAATLPWLRAPTRAFDGEPGTGDLSWFRDGVVNVCDACVDLHAERTPGGAALLALGKGGRVERVGWRGLQQRVARLANVLRECGVRQGDRVAAVLPPGVLAAVFQLGCARIGAVQILLGTQGGPLALRRALRSSAVRVLITSAEETPASSREPLWEVVTEALAGLGRIEAVLVHGGASEVALVDGRDHDLDRAMEAARPTAVSAPCAAEDGLLLIGATADELAHPVLHTVGGFLVNATLGLRVALGVRPGSVVLCATEAPRPDVFFATLALGGTTVVAEAEAALASRAALGVTHLLAPASVLARAPRRPGELRVTLNGPDAEDADPDVRGLWSSEAGGLLGCEWPGTGFTPLPGIEPVLIDALGLRLHAPSGDAELCAARPWPGQPRTEDHAHTRFVEQRCSHFPGLFRTGERCRRTPENALRWTGRAGWPLLTLAGAPPSSGAQLADRV